VFLGREVTVWRGVAPQVAGGGGAGA
jgi:hypothetical protein